MRRPAAQDAVSVLENSTATPADLTAALQAVRYLVEPIDMANGVPLCPA